MSTAPLGFLDGALYAPPRSILFHSLLLASGHHTVIISDLHLQSANSCDLQHQGNNRHSFLKLKWCIFWCFSRPHNQWCNLQSSGVSGLSAPDALSLTTLLRLIRPHFVRLYQPPTHLLFFFFFSSAANQMNPQQPVFCGTWCSCCDVKHTIDLVEGLSCEPVHPASTVLANETFVFALIILKVLCIWSSRKWLVPVFLETSNDSRLPRSPINWQHCHLLLIYSSVRPFFSFCCGSLSF